MNFADNAFQKKVEKWKCKVEKWKCILVNFDNNAVRLLGVPESVRAIIICCVCAFGVETDAFIAELEKNVCERKDFERLFDFRTCIFWNKALPG